MALLPPLLRVYEGCAHALVGTVEKANVLKLNRREARISYLSYPEFEQDPHTPLQVDHLAPRRRRFSRA